VLNRGEWPAAKNQKEDVPKPIQVMFSNLEAKIDSKLKQANNIGGNKQQQNGPRNGGGQQNSETRTCHHCGQVGHIKPNCPQLSKNSNGKNNSNANNRSNGKNGHTTVPSSLPGKKCYKAPGTNDSHTKTIGADTWKWCAKCKRWNKGDSAHLTDEHRAKNKEQQTGPAITVSRLAASSGNGILLKQWFKL
jgi:hypothetical protein